MCKVSKPSDSKEHELFATSNASDSKEHELFARSKAVTSESLVILDSSIFLEYFQI